MEATRAALNLTATVLPSSSRPSKPSMFVGRSTVSLFRSNLPFSCKLHASVPSSKQGHGRKLSVGSKRVFVVRAASSSAESSGSSSNIAPLKLESPIGQFLSQILVSHPHLMSAAVERQLEQFQTDRDGDEQKEKPSASGTDLVLYRRIAEVKAKERRKAIEEILYTLVVQKFMDADVSLIPSVRPHPSGQVDSWPSEDGKLEELHSPEAYEMIQSHLALLLGNRIGDSASVAQISKLRVGQVYAASVMYGYFLKRVVQRFQLEKTMKILPDAEEESTIGQTMEDETRIAGLEMPSQVTPHPEVPTWSGSGISSGAFGQETTVSRLRSYMMSFDLETLQRYATIRSKESVSIIEKHTDALFGIPEIAVTAEEKINSSKDEIIKISIGGLKRLVLEAVTFGSFLWDVESYVDSRYHFVLN
ncbi:UV-B-induced protein At3g17800, chloroplastic-like [Cicer arietinum]|uniref:UV-B-induced protein At3g17800, chloroplastic-like n=1 Tax=Cicer arietinum TaxID=3827 RepID=A0A1S2Z1J8_CICAR|nr:UV-B-induced protein At3g17800, chloroplastic-like [Cicer arietinum]